MIYMNAELEYCSISKRDLFCVSVLFDLSPKKKNKKKKKKKNNNKVKCKLTLRVSKNKSVTHPKSVYVRPYS